MKKQSLLDMAMAATQENLVKGRGASGKKTYLDRFVETLLDDKGQPVGPMKRNDIVASIALDICVEQCEADEERAAFGSEAREDGKAGFNETDLELFTTVGNKVKHQVAAAISDSQNSTALSYNEKYKSVWKVAKHEGSQVSLVAIEAEA